MTRFSPSPDEYPYIRAYGRMMGSDKSYVEDQIDKARADGAPADAWSCAGGMETEPGPRRWRTLSDLDAKAKAGNTTAADTAERLRREAERMYGKAS